MPSRSDPRMMNAAPVAPSSSAWRKASKSHEDGDQCVEIAHAHNAIFVRDSKDPEGSKLIMSRDDFRCFAEILKDF